VTTVLGIVTGEFGIVTTVLRITTMVLGIMTIPCCIVSEQPRIFGFSAAISTMSRRTRTRGLGSVRTPSGVCTMQGDIVTPRPDMCTMRRGVSTMQGDIVTLHRRVHTISN
jgi:hypothetical protein